MGPTRAEEIPGAILRGSSIDALGKVSERGYDPRPQDAQDALFGYCRFVSIQYGAVAGHRDVSFTNLGKQPQGLRSLQCPREASTVRELSGALRKKGAKKRDARPAVCDGFGRYG